MFQEIKRHQQPTLLKVVNDGLDDTIYLFICQLNQDKTEELMVRENWYPNQMHFIVTQVMTKSNRNAQSLYIGYQLVLIKILF